MEVTEALRVPLEPAHVQSALGDLALLRASLDHCESFTRTPSGEHALTLVVPLGALRARYEVRAHPAGRTRQGAEDGAPGHASDAAYARTLSFKARGEGSVRCAVRSRLRSMPTTADTPRGSNTPSGRRCPGRSPACPRARSKTRCAKAPTISSPNSAKSCARSTACPRCANDATRAGTFSCAPARCRRHSRVVRLRPRARSTARLATPPRAACSGIGWARIRSRNSSAINGRSRIRSGCTAGRGRRCSCSSRCSRSSRSAEACTERRSALKSCVPPQSSPKGTRPCRAAP